MGLQPTRGLVCMRGRSFLDDLKYPIEDHTLAHHREPSALEGWILEI